MKRKIKNKPSTIECKLCNQEFSIYGFSSHLLYNHDMTSNDYIEIYGEFRKKKPNPCRIVRKIECQLCHNEYSAVGMHVHLRDTHNISSEQYKIQHAEYNKKCLDYNKRANENKIKCFLCNNKFGSERLLTYHIRIDHKFKKKDYVKKIIFKNNLPLCKCGCKEEVTLKNQYPYRSEFISGHNGKGELNGMFNKTHNSLSLQKMSKKAIARIGNTNKVNTSGERKFKEILNRLNINYLHQYETEYGLIDFYLPDYDLLVEIDGVFWHQDKKESLNFQQLAVANSEFKKNRLNNLVRIADDNLDKINVIDDLHHLSRKMHFIVDYKQKIITKEYFSQYLERKGEQKLRDKIYALLKFIRSYQDSFPYPECEENLSDIINTIASYDFSRIYSDKIFKNNISSIGINYLKSHFKSYWNSKYNGSKSPVDAWYDDKIMRKVIEYRIGLNTSNEVFNFTMHQMIRGLSARRYTISFFKPLLAAAIYKHFIGDNDNPIVIDPCAGFGGRMIGFKSVYPNGTYIGIEPNKDSFNELKILSDNFNNVILYNCKLEEYDGTTKCDLTFTSIPYFDREIYSQNTVYKNMSDWKNSFIRRLIEFDNLIVNTSIEGLFDYKDKYSIKNNSSHFNKKSKFKYDYIFVNR